MNRSRRLVDIVEKERSCWRGILKICSVGEGFVVINELNLALAKEVRIEVLADWVASSSISSSA